MNSEHSRHLARQYSTLSRRVAICRLALFVPWLPYSLCPLAALSTVLLLSLDYSTPFVLWLHLVQ